MELEILYQDKYLVAINKPSGLLVHRTKLANDTNTFALQMLRNQIDQHVYPIHRLDRKTSGVLLFALSEEMHKTMQKVFADRLISKTYLAIVRGFTEDEGVIDNPIIKENGVKQVATTIYKTLDKTEINLPFGKHNTSRYSLMEIKPITGRKHQIRKHMAHIHHPIIADRPHGCNKQNKLFKEKFGLMTMMLHASKIEFVHPMAQQRIMIEAGLYPEFKRMIDELKLNYS